MINKQIESYWWNDYIRNSPYYFKPFTVEILEDDTYIALNGIEHDITSRKVQFKVDDSEWQDCGSQINGVQLFYDEELSLYKTNRIPSGCKKISFAICIDKQLDTEGVYRHFIKVYDSNNANKTYNLSGNIMSLVYGRDFVGKHSLEHMEVGYGYRFDTIFQGLCAGNDSPYDNIDYDDCLGTYVVDASNLILPTDVVSNNSYYCMFANCNKLIKAPKIPAVKIVSTIYESHYGCFSYMFAGCTSLKEFELIPKPLDITWRDGDRSGTYNDMYVCMFLNCVNLENIEINIFECPEIIYKLKYDHINNDYTHTRSMFYGCTKLKIVAKTPSETFVIDDNGTLITFGDPIDDGSNYFFLDENIDTKIKNTLFKNYDNLFDSVPKENITFINPHDYYKTKPLTFNVLETCEFEWEEWREYITPYIDGEWGSSTFWCKYKENNDTPSYFPYLKYSFDGEKWENYSGKLILPAGTKISWKLFNENMDSLPLDFSTIDSTKLYLFLEKNIGYNQTFYEPFTSSYEILVDIEGNHTERYVKSNDYFYEWGKKTNPDGLDNQLCIYKSDEEIYLEDGVDYDDRFFYWGTEVVDGITYDKWKKAEWNYDNNDYCWSTGGGGGGEYYILTKKVVYKDFVITNELLDYAYPSQEVPILYFKPRFKLCENINGKFEVYGNIMSIINYNFETMSELPYAYCFHEFFKDISSLVSAKNLVLPATTLKTVSYTAMFENCTNLRYSPLILPADYGSYYDSESILNGRGAYPVTLGDYERMFSGCTNLITCPIIRISSALVTEGIFSGGTTSSWALYGGVFNNMFNSCKSIVKAPFLNLNKDYKVGANLVGSAFSGVFNQCDKLNYVKIYMDITGYTEDFVYDFLSTNSSGGLLMAGPNSDNDENKIPYYWHTKAPMGWYCGYFTSSYNHVPPYLAYYDNNGTLESKKIEPPTIEKIISFKIIKDDTEHIFYARENMTWYDWIVSTYVDDFKKLLKVKKITPFNFPISASLSNTLIVDELPTKILNDYLYVKYDDEYYYPSIFSDKYIIHENYITINNKYQYPVFCNNDGTSYICKRDRFPNSYDQLIIDGETYRISSDTDFISYDY